MNKNREIRKIRRGERYLLLNKFTTNILTFKWKFGKTEMKLLKNKSKLDKTNWLKTELRWSIVTKVFVTVQDYFVIICKSSETKIIVNA